MPQNQEEIEAKLAAYIDGELDAAGRAEIEKHLEINPQHRTLIRDLTQQRELVRSLPRANAPAEISETLQGQLERSVLLGSGVDAGDDVSMRMSPWPHRGAIAAVVLLTAGLGFLVYKVLPSNKPTAGELAIAPTQSQMQSSTPATLSTEPPPAATPEPPIALTDKDQGFADKIGSPPGQVAPAAASQNQIAASGPQTAAPQVPGPQAVVAPAAGTAANGQATNQTAVALGPEAVGGGNFNNSNAAEPLVQKSANQAAIAATPQQSFPQSSQQPDWCVVVTTDNPSATDAQVRAFLIANQIHFEPLGADSQQADRNDLVASRFRDEGARRLNGELDDNRQAIAATQPATQPVAQQTPQALSLAAPSTQPVNELAGGKSPTTVPTISAGSLALAVQGAPTTAPTQVEAALPTPLPSAVRPDAAASNAPANAGVPSKVTAGVETASPVTPTTSPALAIASSTTQPTTQAALAFAPSKTSQPSGDAETSEYVCPNITTAQANDLKTMLSLRAGQSAQLVASKRVVVPIDGRELPDGSFQEVPPTTQQIQQALDKEIAAPQDQQSGAAQTQSQPIIATQVPTTAPTTSAVNVTAGDSAAADDSKIHLVIVMRRGQVTATPSLSPGTQPAVVPNPSIPTRPANSEVPLKLP